MSLAPLCGVQPIFICSQQTAAALNPRLDKYSDSSFRPTTPGYNRRIPGIQKFDRNGDDVNETREHNLSHFSEDEDRLNDSKFSLRLLPRRRPAPGKIPPPPGGRLGVDHCHTKRLPGLI